jgi:hypothetical protein
MDTHCPQPILAYQSDPLMLQMRMYQHPMDNDLLEPTSVTRNDLPRQRGNRYGYPSDILAVEPIVARVNDPAVQHMNKCYYSRGNRFPGYTGNE